MFGILTSLGLAALALNGAKAAALGAYNVDPNSVSVSGLSSGGFVAVQLGVAYSNTFKTGFGVFAGGPFDCARAQYYTTCMYNQSPSITAPTANMQSWSGNQIDPVGNLMSRKIYMQVGSADTTVGPNVMNQLKAQLANFDTSSNTTFVTVSGAAHTFPTDFNGSGDNACGSASSPYISNCGYDGAGAVLNWMYGNLNARNTGTLSGTVVSFSQTGSYVAAGMDTTGYLYVPQACQGGSTVCKLHVALHGCLQSYSQIGFDFVDNTGYNMWADTNNIIILFPQTIVDNTVHTTWGGTMLPNPNACWDWVGWYGQNADQKGGVQMVALVNQVNQIISGYNAGSGNPSSTSSTSSSHSTGSSVASSSTFVTSTTTKTSTAATSTSSSAPLYGQCGGIGWTGPTTCASGVCTAYSSYYAQCLLPLRRI